MDHNFSFCKTCETPLDCDFCDKLGALLEPGHMTLEELIWNTRAPILSSREMEILEGLE